MNPTAETIYKELLDKFRASGAEQRQAFSIHLGTTAVAAGHTGKLELSGALFAGVEALLVVDGFLKLEEEKIEAER